MTKFENVMAAGYTLEVLVHTGEESFHALIKETQDLNKTFSAWDVDSECWIEIHGFNCTFEIA